MGREKDTGGQDATSKNSLCLTRDPRRSWFSVFVIMCSAKFGYLRTHSCSEGITTNSAPQKLRARIVGVLEPVPAFMGRQEGIHPKYDAGVFQATLTPTTYQLIFDSVHLTCSFIGDTEGPVGL